MTQKKSLPPAVSVGSRARLACRGIKTYSESRIEMRNLHILNKMLKNQDVVLNIAAVEKYARKTCVEHWKPFDSSFERKERWQVKRETMRILFVFHVYLLSMLFMYFI